MAHGSIDRFEGEVAVLIVDGREQHVPRAKLPKGAREGDVIDLGTMRVDAAATERLREETREAMERAGRGKTQKPGSFDLD
jgi:hypothetical protein